MDFKLLILLCITTLPLHILCQNLTKDSHSNNTEYEKEPQSSPLVISGYNLPGPIFNNGQPFYVEKDPITGQIDFNSKTPAGKSSLPSYSDEYDYTDEEPSTNIFDKSNINRKDGGFGSHRPNDINQLTPNFHDFLNLPVKYNPDKYVYPLISSSYANTKIQGNVNNYNNHKYNVVSATYKPTVSPTYYTTKQNIYYRPSTTSESHVKFTTTTTQRPTTTEKTLKIQSTTIKNLLNSGMNHPSYYTTEDNEYDNDYDYYTTKAPEKIEKSTTTKRPYSIFDELFGDYEPEPEHVKPSLFGNMPSINFGDKIVSEKEITKTTPTTTTTAPKINETKSSNNLVQNANINTNNNFMSQNSNNNIITQSSNNNYNIQSSNNNYNIQSSNNIPISNYNEDSEFEYDYSNMDEEDNVTEPIMSSTTPSTTTTSTTTTTTTKKPEKIQHVFSNFHQNYRDPVESLFDSYTPPKENKTVINETKTTEKSDYISITSSESYEDYEENEMKSSTKIVSITETPPSMRVTSLPLGENHPMSNHRPMISISNLKEQLNNEKVSTTTKTPDKIEGMIGGQKVMIVRPMKDEELPGDATKETFISNSFRPLYTPNKIPDQKVQPSGVVKETLTFTGTGQINSNYSWTVPQKNKYDTFPDDMPPSKVYKQEIHSNYSWSVPESTPKTQSNTPLNTPMKTEIKYQPQFPQQSIKYTPTQNNAIFNSGQNDFNLQQVNAGYSVGQSSGSSYGHGTVFTVGTTYAGGNKYKPLQPQYQYAQVGTNYNLSVYPEVTSSIKIQPVSGSEASLSIGSPANGQKVVPGKVMDEKLDLKDPEVQQKKPGNRIVFPEDKPVQTSVSPQKEILSLYSKPMLHQLPAELTPPLEQEIKQVKPTRPSGNIRPPWDPRPGHFYQGRPEYARPPRPLHKPEVYKRIDGLPNILPQFRPNAKIPDRNHHHHHHDIPINSGYMQRQPLLDRPSNRPIGFFQNLHPPPPPKRILELRKPVTLNQHLIQNEKKQEKTNSESKHQPINFKTEHQYVFPTPPKVPIANRRNGEDESEIATLQMLHAKQTDKLNTLKPNVPPPFKINFDKQSNKPTEKPLYVVYPVNSSPLKLDVLDTDKRESVVIGTRGEQPLPPSKINQDFPTYVEQKPLFKPKNDAPILKPQARPTIKNDFPYPLERPDPTVLYQEDKTGNANNIDNSDTSNKFPELSNNQWNTLETESRIINGNKINYVNEQISATLKTYTPIAIAYTPTESSSVPSDDIFSMPNYGSAVISEIRNDKLSGDIIKGEDKSRTQGIVTNAGSEFTVSAVMHTHTQNNNLLLGSMAHKNREKVENHRVETETEDTMYPTKLEFQAPFHASVNIGSSNSGWSVVRDKSKNSDRSGTDGSTTIEPETSSKFDIENFTPQLFSGFKPIFEFPEEKEKETDNINDREE